MHRLSAASLFIAFSSIGAAAGAAGPAIAKPAPVSPVAPNAAKPKAGAATASATGDSGGKSAPKAPDDDLVSGEDMGKTAPAATPSGAPAQKTGPSVLLLPFQPVFRSVPQAKIQIANDLLTKELNHKDNVVVIRGGVSKGESAAPSTAGAVKLIEAAKQAEAAHAILQAIDHRKKAIEEMEKNAAAVEADDYVLAHHYLARALMWAGLDKEATDMIDAAARMRPAFPLEAKEFSRLYRKWFAKAGEQAVSAKPGDLLISSALPGAAITLDGRPMDTAPVLLKKVVAGKHLIGAKIEGVPPYAGVIDVKPGKKNEFTVSFANTMGGSAVGAVADAMAQNSIPKKAVESAAQAGKEAGAAYVVLGALAKDEDRFHVHPYVVQVQTAKIAPLDVVDFDLELLTAESDVLRIVQNVASVVNRFSGEEKAVATIEKRIRSTNTVNEVAAAPSVSNDDGKRESADKKKAARSVYQPLKGGTIKIKDEEE